MGVRVDWFDQVIRKILKVKNHQKLVHTTNLIRGSTKDLQRQLNTLVDELKQAKDEIAKQDIDPFASGDYMVSTGW